MPHLVGQDIDHYHIIEKPGHGQEFASEQWNYDLVIWDGQVYLDAFYVIVFDTFNQQQEETL